MFFAIDKMPPNPPVAKPGICDSSSVGNILSIIPCCAACTISCCFWSPICATIDDACKAFKYST